MNEPLTHPWEDDPQLDRLVDGELTGEEYRQTLAALDAQPNGWRRCALAFLEAQALGQEFSAARRDLEVRTARRATARFAARESWATYLAIAASLLVALAAGISLRGWPLFVEPGVVESAPGETQPTNVAQGDAADAAKDSRRAIDPLGSLTLVVDGPSGQGEPIRLPVYDERHAAERLSFDRSALPPDVLRALERTGHQVESRQELVPVVLQDGRQVVFPVEQFRIVPAARRPY